MEHYGGRGERMLLWQLSALCGLIDTTYCHRCSASGHSGATDLETSSAKVTKSHIDCRVCVRYLVYCPFFCVSSTSTLPALELELAFLADDCSESSVTFVSIVRLTYLVKDRSTADFTFVYANIFIWTSVEANVSIICGQYIIVFSARSYI